MVVLLLRPDPVPITAPVPKSADAAATCADFVRRLPAVVDGHDRRSTSPESPYVRAWGRPAIVLFCGVGTPPELTPTSVLTVVNGVDWLQVEEASGWRFTSVGRVVNVQVLVPKAYDQPANPLLDLASAVKHLPLSG